MKDYKMKIFMLSVMILVILPLNACGTNSEKVTYISTTKENAQIILDGIKTEDFEETAEIFSPYVKEKYPDLENDIAELMEYIDGDVESYESVVCRAGAGTSTEEGWVERYIYGDIRNIKTNIDKTYTITFSGYYVNKDQPEKEGVSQITIESHDVVDEEGRPEWRTIYYE